MANKGLCFVIAPIGEKGTEIRARSDQLLKHIIKPAAAECGYDAVRADEISDPGSITSQIIQHVVEDPMVLADLTGRNPNVFYELAIRHALRKPFVQIIQAGEKPPFDIADVRTVSVDCHDLDVAAAAKEDIIKQMRAAESSGGDVETPLSRGVEVSMLKRSDNPLERSAGEILTALQTVQTGLTGLSTEWEEWRKAYLSGAFYRDQRLNLATTVRKGFLEHEKKLALMAERDSLVGRAEAINVLLSKEPADSAVSGELHREREEIRKRSLAISDELRDSFGLSRNSGPSGPGARGPIGRSSP